MIPLTGSVWKSQTPRDRKQNGGDQGLGAGGAGGRRSGGQWLMGSFRLEDGEGVPEADDGDGGTTGWHT